MIMIMMMMMMIMIQVLSDNLDPGSPEAARALAVSRDASAELTNMKNICLEGGGPKGATIQSINKAQYFVQELRGML